jgi:hypothetical protein
MGAFGVFDADDRLLWSEFGGVVPVMWAGCAKYRAKPRVNVISLNVIRVFLA